MHERMGRGRIERAGLRRWAPPLLGLLALFGGRAHAGEAEADPAGWRDFRLTYRTVVPRPAQDAKRVEVWVPLPYESPVQQLVELSVSAPIPYEVTVDPAPGNRMVHVRVDAPRQDVTVTWTAVVRRVAESGQEPARDPGAWLRGDRLAPVDETARRQAEEIGATDAGEPIRARARRIFDHVVASTEYDKVEPGWGTGDFARVTRVGKGNCSDFTARFVTLARAAGIPARWVSTIALSEDHASCDGCGYHCYGHYLEDGRWVPVDPSDARRALEHDPSKSEWLFGHAERSNVILSVGRDLTLVPAQQAGPLNYFASPYVEIDGKPVDLEGKNRTYEFEAL